MKKLNENGFMTMAFLILLPLLLTLVAVVGAAALVIKTDSRSRHVCRSELLASHVRINTVLEDLLAMNEGAAELRSQRRNAETQVEMTVGTPAQASAEAELAAIIAQQVAYAEIQQSLIADAEGLAHTAPAMTFAKVTSAIQADGAINRQSLVTVKGGARPGHFAVRADPIDSLTPNYSAAEDFQSQIKMQVSWAFDLAQLLPSWLATPLRNQIGEFSANCSTTLKQENDRWIAKIVEDRY